MFVPTLLAASAALAEVDTGTASPAQTLPSATPGADARERGLTALRDGDYLTAATALQEAADHGDAAALRHLGDLAFSGQGVAQSYEQAIRWYCQAALATDLEAVGRLEAITLASWSAQRDALGWEAACKSWMEPSPPPVQPQAAPLPPEVKVEILMQPGPVEYVPALVWPGYAPWHWQRVNPRPPIRKHEHPRAPGFAPGALAR